MTLIAAVFFGALVGLIYGFEVGHRKRFPFEQLRRLAQNLSTGRTRDKVARDPRVDLFSYISSRADVVMLGDSNTSAGLWNEYLPNVAVANRGIDGNTLSDMLIRLDSVIKLEPKVVLLMGGTNDFLQGESVESVVQNCFLIVNALESENVLVVIQSILECSRPGRLQMLEHIREANLRIKDCAASKGIDFIDINEGITSEDYGLLGEFTYDGVHLVGSAYDRWAKAIATQLGRAECVRE